MPPVLAYWDIRGLGEFPRLLLHYLQVDFEDKRYTSVQGYDRFDNLWTKHDKFNLGIELPNLPYYIDGDVKISQSLAIMRYLARKHNLYYPSNDSGRDIIRFDVLEGHAIDMSRNLSYMGYSPLFHELRESMKSHFEYLIQETADILGSNTWLFGEKISHIDFILFETLDKIKLCYKDCLDQHENLRNYMERVESLPGVKKYRSTSPKWPLFLPYATWGGRCDPPK